MRHSYKSIGVEWSFVKVWLSVKLSSSFHLLYLSTKLYELTLYIHSNWNSVLLSHNKNTGTRFLQARACICTCVYWHPHILAYSYIYTSIYLHTPIFACSCAAVSKLQTLTLQKNRTTFQLKCTETGACFLFRWLFDEFLSTTKVSELHFLIRSWI